MAEGFFHWFEGWVIFCLAAVLLATEILVLEKLRLGNVTIDPVFLDHSTASVKSRKAPALRGSAIATTFVCAASLGVAGLIVSAQGSISKPDRETFALFPQQIENWTGRQSHLDASSLQTLKATDYYVGDFSRDRTPAVNLFIAYYDSLARGEAIHSPRVCLPGAGWEFSTFQERNFSDVIPGMTGTFNRVVIQKGLEKMLMYYWFQQRERRTANEFSMKYYLLADSLTKSRKDGALVRLLTPIHVGSEKGEVEADDSLKAFIASTAPKLDAYLPR
jgi:EpsI family protein